MLKLYKQIDDQLHYWETWDSDSNGAIIHWGIVGETGEQKDVRSGLFSSYKKAVQREIDQKTQ